MRVIKEEKRTKIQWTMNQLITPTQTNSQSREFSAIKQNHCKKSRGMTNSSSRLTRRRPNELRRLQNQLLTSVRMTRVKLLLMCTPAKVSRKYMTTLAATKNEIDWRERRNRQHTLTTQNHISSRRYITRKTCSLTTKGN